MRYESREDLADKVDWEGGVAEAILGYGICSEDLPEGTPEEIIRAWRTIEAIASEFDVIQGWLS